MAEPCHAQYTWYNGYIGFKQTNSCSNTINVKNQILALSYCPSGYMAGRIILEYDTHRLILKLELCLEAAVGINSLCKNLCQSLLLAFQVMFSIHKIQFLVCAQ